MSVRYDGEFDVYCAMSKIFDKLYGNKNGKFKGVIDKRGGMYFERQSDDSFKSPHDGLVIRSNVVDDYLGLLVSELEGIEFGPEYLYKDNEAYLYVGELTCDYDDDYGTSISSSKPEIYEESLKMEDILTLKNDKDTWKYLKSTSEEFTNIIKVLSGLVNKLSGRTYEEIGYNIGKVYMNNDKLSLSAFEYEDGIIGTFEYDYNDDVKSACTNLINILKSFKYGVREIYWFAKGDMNSVKIRKHEDGEVTIVVI